ATDATAVALAAIPGVVSVEPTDRAADSRSYQLRIDPDQSAGVQRAVTRLAADNDLTVIDNSLVREGLEDVFMRLVENKERAA
ncbi:MAG TPA: hypothetical protein VFV59_06375, partial [Candidatus Limnocylindria bacterium]|nr:hypothetical protein [Candidatus Limnocylindria bacterium]